MAGTTYLVFTPSVHTWGVSKACAVGLKTVFTVFNPSRAGLKKAPGRDGWDKFQQSGYAASGERSAARSVSQRVFLASKERKSVLKKVVARSSTFFCSCT